MAADEMAIAWIVGKQLFMTAAAGDLAIFEKTNLVNSRQRFRGMGNKQPCSASQVVKDGLCKSASGHVVEPFCGFIKDPDRGVLEKRPGENQPPGFPSGEQRAGLSHPRALLRDLKEEVAGQTGAELPKAAPLHRVTGRQLLTFALTLLAAYALIGMLSGIDFAEVWEELQNASWGWVLAAFIVSQLPLLSDATAMMAAVAQPIPLEPTI